MPQVFKGGSYWIYFWSNEDSPKPNAIKVWITSAGKSLLANNNSDIPKAALRNIMRIIEARSEDVVNKWCKFYGEVEHYC